MKNIKRLILILAYVVLSTWGVSDFVSAKIMNSRDIEIRAKEKKNIPRSILPVRAWVDGKTVCVTFFDLPNTATVRITNMENGEVLTKTYQSPETVSILLLNGEYEIQITYGQDSFIGYFDL
ncbi:MAG: DUF3244 domain-containing protein [Parabacteroides sp.]|nr:DUF3244 domain-containing protein [Parabacteroides sp.]